MGFELTGPFFKVLLKTADAVAQVVDDPGHRQELTDTSPQIATVVLETNIILRLVTIRLANAMTIAELALLP